MMSKWLLLTTLLLVGEQRDAVTHQDLDHKLDIIYAGQGTQDHQISINTEHLKDLDARMEALEHQDVAARLARLEVVVNTNQQILIGVIISVLASAIFGIWVLVNRKLRNGKTG